MADRIISAEAIITAKDGTGDVFAAIARKVQGLGKQTTASPQLEGMVKNLRNVEAQMRAIDKLQATRDRASNARGQYDKATAAANAAKRAIEGVEAPTKKMIAASEQAAAAASRAGEAFLRQAKAVQEAKRASESMGVPIANIAAGQERLRAIFNETTKAIEHQAIAERQAAKAHTEAERAQERRAHGIAHHGVVNYAAGAAAGYVGAHGVVEAIADTTKAGARYQHEVVSLQNAGRTPEEMAEIEARSRETARQLPTATYEENLKVVNETTGAFGNLHHALENLTFMQKSSAVLHAAAGDKIGGDAGELGNQLARFFEERQVAGDTPRFQREAEGLVRAMAFTRGNFNPEQAMGFAQQAKSALPNYSERFLTKIVPSLVTEYGGDRAGTAANAFNSVITGKVNDKKQAEEWLKYGLLDPKQTTMKAGHAVGWRAGAVKGTDLALADPLQWAEDVALPAIKANGVNTDDRMELTKVLATMFRNQNGNMFANAIMQAASRQRLEKDEANINQAGTLNQIYDRNLQNDPTVAITALKASLENLMSAASSPAMSAAAAGITSVATALQGFSEFAKNHPTAAVTGGVAAGTGALAGAGYMSYQLMNGFGLGGAATALEGSAAALDAAAAKLGVGGVAHDLEGAVPGMVPGKGGRFLRFAAGATIAGAVAYEGLGAAADYLHSKGVPDVAQPNADANSRQDMRDSALDLGARFSGRSAARQYAPPPLPGQRVPMFVGGGMPGPLGPATGGGPQTIDVTGKVQSEVHTDVAVKFSLSVPPGFSAQQTFQSVTSKPSTGVSMPQAAAPATAASTAAP